MLLEGGMFYFNPKHLFFEPGSCVAYLNEFACELQYEIFEDQGEHWISRNDWTRMLSHVEKMRSEGNACFTLLRDGILYGPLEKLAGFLPGASFARQGDLLWISLEGAGQGKEWERTAKVTPEAEWERLLARISLQRKGKEFGDFYFTYWLEGLKKWFPYRFYIPTAAEEGGALPLVICLHGGRGGANSMSDLAKGRLQEMAERHGMYLLCPDGVTFDSTYGCLAPPSCLAEEQIDGTCPENPLHFTEEEQERKAWGEKGLLFLLELLKQRYPIHPEQIFLMGNSMGGMGTFYLGTKYPELFHALAPSGTMPDLRFFPWEKLKETPVLFLAGTEDGCGFSGMRRLCRKMKEAGIPIAFQTIGGGAHSDAWVSGLSDIFAFFERSQK